MERKEKELETLKTALGELQQTYKREKEKMNEEFSSKLKGLEIQLRTDVENVEANLKRQYDSNEAKMKQSIARENDVRISALQEGFAVERNRLEAKISNLADQLEDSGKTNEKLYKERSQFESKFYESETKTKKLEQLLRQVHDEQIGHSNRANQAESEITVLQAIIERQCDERGRITETINAIKKELIKAKLPEGQFSFLLMK